MHTKIRVRFLAAAAAGVLAGFSTGCQTWVGGMTLPSGHYLEHHPPQYFPEEPAFPLQRELNYQQETAGLLNAGDKAGALNPAPVPGGGPAGPAK